MGKKNKGFWIDLSPLLERREEFYQMAEDVKKQNLILKTQKYDLKIAKTRLKQLMYSLREIGNEKAYQEALNAYLPLSKKKRTQDALPSLLEEYSNLLETIEKAFMTSP